MTKRLLFFSGAGYAAPAVTYADSMDVALFKYDLLGRMNPVNSAAREIAERYAARTDSQMHERGWKLNKEGDPDAQQFPEVMEAVAAGDWKAARTRYREVTGRNIGPFPDERG